MGGRANQGRLGKNPCAGAVNFRFEKPLINYKIGKLSIGANKKEWAIWYQTRF